MTQQQSLWQILMQDSKDLNEKVGEAVYVLIVDDIMVASTRKSDINEYLLDEKAIVPDFLTAQRMSEPCSGITLIYGMVLNSQELPIELTKDSEDLDVWVIAEDNKTNLIGSVEHESFDTIEDVVKEVEKLMEKDPKLTIDDIAVIVGSEVNMVLQIGSASADVNVKKLKDSLF